MSDAREMIPVFDDKNDEIWCNSVVVICCTELFMLFLLFIFCVDDGEKIFWCCCDLFGVEENLLLMCFCFLKRMVVLVGCCIGWADGASCQVSMTCS